MLFTFLRTQWYFKSAVLISLLGIRAPFKTLFYAGRSLNKKSFRFPEKANTDFLIALKIYKRIFSGIIQKNNACLISGFQSNEALFDSSLDDATGRVEYIEKLSGNKIGLVIAKNQLLFF